jgi:peroxiredoxin Q/BCP
MRAVASPEDQNMKTLAAGRRAPDFHLPDQDGKVQDLGELLFLGPVVLFFFPTAGSAGCIREAVHVRDLAAESAAGSSRP